MKIKEMYVDFTDTIDIGKFSFFIILDKNGIDMHINDIINQAEHFDNVVIDGDEIFEQKKELVEIINKLQERNKNGVIQLITKGTIKPVGLKDLVNLNFIVEVQLKNSNIDYNERIKLNEINWFIEANSKFVFNIEEENSIDEAGMIIKELNIKRKNVYLLVDTNDKEIIKYIKAKAKLLGVNYTIKFNKLLED